MISDTQSNLDACFARAVELIWSGNPDATCGEVKAQLIREFGTKTVEATLAALKKGKTEEYPDPLTSEQRNRYEAAMAEIQPDLDRVCEEIERCQRLTAADYAVTINAR